jgi:hypothetical protein
MFVKNSLCVTAVLYFFLFERELKYDFCAINYLKKKLSVQKIPMAQDLSHVDISKQRV